MNKNAAETIIDRIKHALRVNTDTELCNETGVNRQTLSNWKSRDHVPYPLCVQIADSHDISLDWLLTGAGPMERWSGLGSIMGKSGLGKTMSGIVIGRTMTEREYESASDHTPKTGIGQSRLLLTLLDELDSDDQLLAVELIEFMVRTKKHTKALEQRVKALEERITQ
ncbi:helix-turn-helix transcriptional regulator [Chrysiogenes arsenatis]|uniref:helix-turn-helix transcriptional regulator n=1 Tax=Chrysiogenes arsenatis TaxID=309797 RepID=UPI00054DD994|nr:helix-turn-helix transcriptional regulator [Chrysiogenes arsenatis]